MIEAYMVFGGTPQYYRMLRPELSLAGNIDLLCLSPTAPLRGEFVVDSGYAAELRDKVAAFRGEHPTCRKTVHLALVTQYGVARNAHFQEVVMSKVDAESLFS